MCSVIVIEASNSGLLLKLIEATIVLAKVQLVISEGNLTVTLQLQESGVDRCIPGNSICQTELIVVLTAEVGDIHLAHLPMKNCAKSQLTAQLKHQGWSKVYKA